MEKLTAIGKLVRFNQDGRIAVPLLLLFCGAPVGVVFVLWLFIFRGH